MTLRYIRHNAVRKASYEPVVLCRSKIYDAQRWLRRLKKPVLVFPLAAHRSEPEVSKRKRQETFAHSARKVTPVHRCPASFADAPLERALQGSLP